METYHKIQTLFKREQDGPKKGRMIRGAWTTPELEYLAGNEWEFTEKVDGTNIRVGYNQIVDNIGRAGDWGVSREVEFGGRSDSAMIPKPLLAYLYETFTTERFTEAGFPLQDPAYSMVLFGEGYGAKIQNGGLYRPDQAFVLFDVKIGSWWLRREDVNDVADKLGISSVPVVGYGTLQQAIEIVEDGYTFNKNGAIVRYGNGGLNSKWGSFHAEGIVARPLVPLFDRKGQRIITKIKGVDFK